jgi:hypothetical protein
MANKYYKSERERNFTGALEAVADGVREADEVAGDGARGKQRDGRDALHLLSGIFLLGLRPSVLRLCRRRLTLAIRLRV